MIYTRNKLHAVTVSSTREREKKEGVGGRKMRAGRKEARERQRKKKR